MGKITLLRPNGFKTETESWNEDTKTLDSVKNKIEKKEVSEDNYFSLFSKISNVSDRTSLGGGNKYIERLKYCNKLEKELMKAKNDKEISNKIYKERDW